MTLKGNSDPYFDLDRDSDPAIGLDRDQYTAQDLDRDPNPLLNPDRDPDPDPDLKSVMLIRDPEDIIQGIRLRVTSVQHARVEYASIIHDVQ